ncbi:MAG: hypothetical protein DMD97_10280, partial [Candidatus Rokuibacteriota bacterium]
STGMPVGGLLTQLVALALTAVGWRWTAFLSGAAVLLVGLPIARLVHHRPEPRGEWPDGEPPAASPRVGTETRAAGVDFTPREAMRTPALRYRQLRARIPDPGGDGGARLGLLRARAPPLAAAPDTVLTRPGVRG